MHRIQRVPGNSNRRHTSTVTVALLDAAAVTAATVDESDLVIETYRGTGPGGQHRNTSDTGVRVTHTPTGIVAKVDRGRSWFQNRQAAIAELTRRVQAAAEGAQAAEHNATRVDQIGAGDRPSHDWTWCGWRDEVTCHAGGKRWLMSKALRGRFLGA